MAAPRITNPAKPNEHPRQPNMALLMANMGAIQAAGQHAIVELRGFGLHALADSLRAEIEKVRTIHSAAALRVRGAVTAPAETDGEPDE